MNEIAIYPSLKNKVVIITGGAQGIGESIVEQFIKQESKVAFLDIDEKAAENLINKINRSIRGRKNVDEKLIETRRIPFLRDLCSTFTIVSRRYMPYDNG